VTAADRLANPDAILTRSDPAELGWPRRGVDAIIRGAGAVVIPGYSRPVVSVAADRRFLEEHRYDGGARVAVNLSRSFGFGVEENQRRSPAAQRLKVSEQPYGAPK
jgi:hypothetical protein